MGLRYLFKEAQYYKRLGKGHLNRMILKFLLAKTPLSKIVNSPIYNKIYLNRIKKKIRKKSARLLQIENTSFCNARCLMCPHTKMKRKQKTMTLEEFKKICQNIIPYEKIENITITGFGEPFIDKGIVDKIEWINKMHPKIDIDIYTNAALLTKDIVDQILKLKIHKINFSINGTKKSYNKIMGLDYKKTEKNILYFLNKKEKMGKNFPLTNVSLMILQDNKNEIEEVIKFWKEKTDSVMAYLPSDWAGQLAINAGIKNPFKFKRWPCSALWRNVTVDVEGNAIMCCRDYESLVKFGNLLKEDIKKIKNSEKMKKLQKNQINGNFSTPVCHKCDNCFDSSLEWWS